MARDLSASQGPVLVGLSGGVDSSYAAFCLRQEGFSVIGVSLQVWDYSECDVRQGIGTCCSHLDVEEARFVATQLGIPFYVLDVKPQFQESIVKPFVDQYVQGQTPLPCAWCNRHVKLRELVEKMFLWDCHQVATGHYARRGLWQGFPVIQKAVDELKDQTYFLFDIPREWISYLRFPLGDFTKTQVREMAQQAGLINARKKDSQGICFVGNQSYTEFIERKFPYKIHPSHEGPIRLYPSGQVLGYHQGYWRYTVGQARGLGLGYHEKLFVLSVDPATATVWVGPEAYLWQKGFWVTNLQWHVPFESLKNQAIWAKIRANHPGARVAHWELTDEGLYVEFENSQKAITPGQAAVFYVDNQFLVGGGWIKKIHVQTFGCKVNLTDSALLESDLKGAFQQAPTAIHVINTCTVTQKAHQEALSYIRRIRRQDPQALIVVTGCAAQVDPESFQKTGWVDLIVGNTLKDQLVEKLKSLMESRAHQQAHLPEATEPYSPGGVSPERANSSAWPSQTPRVWHKPWKKNDQPILSASGVLADRKRAFLRVQDGCDQFCSYCVIPWARGRSRSLEPEEILQQLRHLEQSGFQEVIITGVHLADWRYRQWRLEQLLSFLLDNTNSIRLRISSLDPQQVTQDFLKLFHSRRMAEHIHLSVQSWQDRVLKDMKRWYGAEGVTQALDLIGSWLPDAFVSMDMIVGFPTEDEKAFETTFNHLENHPVWTKLHVFPFSPRPKTRAATLKPLPSHVVKSRLKLMNQLSSQRWWQKALAQKGTRKWVLPLLKRGWGISSDYWNVRLPADISPQDGWLPVWIEDVFGHHNRPCLEARVLT